MMEALACGTPVIACPCGSVPEVLRSGVNRIIANVARSSIPRGRLGYLVALASLRSGAA
jgi:glycosyltransferase involved in cell wall biosynthesis